MIIRLLLGYVALATLIPAGATIWDESRNGHGNTVGDAVDVLLAFLLTGWIAWPLLLLHWVWSSVRDIKLVKPERRHGG